MPLMHGMSAPPWNITNAKKQFRQKLEQKAHPTLSNLITTLSRSQKSPRLIESTKQLRN